MRYIRYAFWALVALILIVVCFANRGTVELRLLPDALADAVPGLSWLGTAVSVPLFVALMIGVAVGLVIGLIWEWIREHPQRVEARRHIRHERELEAEVNRLKAEKHEGKDEVLALLDQTG
ncbi:LapA family protein [Histidinibacterium aquaticum]|uniref:LapA family protein n=1 Tax=Histidinibacterium aquaticum TaxID=2613962 RepID=A0A5J5GCN0_9RHOB|nr:LapA family protein [Histidinibacterium aquaticum]KAA9005184.1 LapA family protein [Histidinibacterium aquaticum]